MTNIAFTTPTTSPDSNRAVDLASFKFLINHDVILACWSVLQACVSTSFDNGTIFAKRIHNLIGIQNNLNNDEANRPFITLQHSDMYTAGGKIRNLKNDGKLQLKLRKMVLSNEQIGAVHDLIGNKAMIARQVSNVDQSALNSSVNNALQSLAEAVKFMQLIMQISDKIAQI